MPTIIAAMFETLAGPLIVLVWLARTVVLCGGALFLFAAAFAHKGIGIAVLYFAQAVVMTLVLHFFRKLRTRVVYR